MARPDSGACRTRIRPLAFSTQPETALFVSRREELRFSKLVEAVCARALGQVRPCVQQIEAAVQDGLYAAGFIAYEAAPAFDTDLATHPAGELPLLWFGLYEDIEASRPMRTGRGGDACGGR